MAVRVKLTYQDYLELPDDGKQYQIIDGALVATPAPGRSHQGTSGNLYSILRNHILDNARGEIYFSLDVVLNRHAIVRPDLVYIDLDRLGMLADHGMTGPPTLVAEVLSPDTNQIDRDCKSSLYARHGVPYYWIVDPQTRYIEAYEITGGTYELTGYLHGMASGSLPPFNDLTIRLIDVWS